MRTMSCTTLSRCNSKGSDLQECLACEKASRRVALYVNLALTLFKAFIGFVCGSRAMLGDALFSFKDFIASLVVIIGIQVSGKPADEQHPYGHGKLEYVALLLMSAGLIVPTLFLLVHSGKDTWHYFYDYVGVSNLVVFWAALISVVVNYKLVQYLRCVGDKMHTPSLFTAARNNYYSAISSIMVAVAILGTRYLGLMFLDPLVAFLQAVCLLAMGGEMLTTALKGLLDSGAPVATVERIESIVRIVPGVRKVARVVARRLGQGLWVDMTIKVDPALTHQDGHLIVRHVKESIQSAFGNQITVNVVLEPYMP